MKKSGTSVGILLTAMLYVFAAWLQSTQVILLSSSGQPNDPSEHPFITPFSSALYCPTSRTETSVIPVSSGGNSGFRIITEKESPLANITWHFFERSFTRYFHASLNFIIPLTRTDIIFPFHNFW